jgi:hypothetical protein
MARVQASEPKLTVSLHSEGSVIVDGKFASAAVVTVISDSKMSDNNMLEMRAGVSAAFRCGYESCCMCMLSE